MGRKPQKSSAKLPRSVPFAYGKDYRELVPEELLYKGASLPRKRTIQQTYKDSDLAIFEAAWRRNWMVRNALLVKTAFIFSKGSKLVLELTKTGGMTKEQIDKALEEKSFIALKNAIEEIDAEKKLVKNVKIAYQQAKVFGRSAIVIEGSIGSPALLKTPNPRRYALPEIDTDTWEFLGLKIDSVAFTADELIYFVNLDLEISPNTMLCGYSEIEPIARVAETLNIALEQDMKQIFKSGWLATILLEVMTEGLSQGAAQAKIKAIVDAAMKSGKIIGFNQQVKATTISFQPDFAGIVTAINELAQIVAGAFRIPKFLIGKEDIPNRATAITAATMFVDGPISEDHEWLTETLQEQWYDKLTRIILGTKEGEPLPVRVKRVFEKPKISEFIDLVDAVVMLFDKGIWDLQKANEVLGSEDVLERIRQEQTEFGKQEGAGERKVASVPSEKPPTPEEQLLAKQLEKTKEEIKTEQVEQKVLEKEKEVLDKLDETLKDDTQGGEQAT